MSHRSRLSLNSWKFRRHRGTFALTREAFADARGPMGRCSLPCAFRGSWRRTLRRLIHPPRSSLRSRHPSSWQIVNLSRCIHLVPLPVKLRRGVPQQTCPASIMKAVLTDPDVDWQDLVYQPCFRKKLHKWMANRAWLPTKIQRSEVHLVLADPGKAIEEEVEGVLQNGDAGKVFTREELLELCKEHEE